MTATSRPSAPCRAPGPSANTHSARCYSHRPQETDEESDALWVTYLGQPDSDAWELRKGMSMLLDYYLVPESQIPDAALRACRRFNDFAGAAGILGGVKD